MPTKLIHTINGIAPILLEMPHSGRVGLKTMVGVPEILASKIRFNSQNVRKTIGFGCDAAVPEMTGYDNLISAFNLSGIRDDLARVYLDMNRAKNEISGLALAGADPKKYHHGIIWARTILTGVDLTQPIQELEKIVEKQCEPLLDHPLAQKEFDFFLGEYHDRYHSAIKEHHARIKAQHGHCIHLALHSLPAVSITTVNGGYILGDKQTREKMPDIILIHNNFQSADKKIIETIRNVFLSVGLTVQDGAGPFLGNNGVTAMYGNPEQNIHVVGIEHVTFDVEPERHLGNPIVDLEKARKFQNVYKKLIEKLLSNAYDTNPSH